MASIKNRACGIGPIHVGRVTVASAFLVAILFAATGPSLASAAEALRPVRVERYVDAFSGKHLVTTEVEGPAFPGGAIMESVPKNMEASPFFYLVRERRKHMVPVYRFLDVDGSVIFVTTAAERREMRRQGLQEVPRPLYIYDKPVEGTSEVFSIRSPRGDDIVYTASARERDYYRAQGWRVLPSLGHAQATSSAGTAILLPTTLKIEAQDLPFVDRYSNHGEEVVFRAGNARFDALSAGVVLYAEKSHVFPFGLLRKVESITITTFGERVVQTVPAELAEAFEELHIYLDSQPVRFMSDQVDYAGAITAVQMAESARGLLSMAQEPDLPPGTVIPEYLAATGIASEATVEAVAGSLDLSRDFLFASTLYSKPNASLAINGKLTLGVTFELILDLNFLSPDASRAAFLLTPRQTLSIDVTATGQVSGQKELKLLGPYGITFALGGIPITGSLTLFGGYSASGKFTASLSATESLRMTAGAEYASKKLTKIVCPNPCPSGFNCGPSRQTGPTCSLTANASGSLSVEASARVYLKPQVDLYIGAFASGLGIYGYAKAQLEATPECSNVSVHAQVIPGAGGKIQVLGRTLLDFFNEYSPVYSKKVLSISMPPLPPTRVTATDGSSSQKVSVTWPAVNGASSYKVYRSTALMTARSFVGQPTATTFGDTSATPALTYWYFVTTVCAGRESPFGTFDTGYRALAAPTSVTASDGTYSDRVLITWSAAWGATAYRVYRATSPSGSRSLVGTPTSTSYSDPNASRGVTYYYWVTSLAAGKESAQSSYNTGFRR